MPQRVINRVREIREAKSLSQEAVGKKIGKARGQISAIESGAIKLSENWLNMLSDALDCSPSELIGGGAMYDVPILGEVPGGNLIAALDAPPDGFVQFSSRRQNLRALRVRGNSMSRLAPDGAYVIVDFSDTDPAYLHNQPVIVCIECPTTGEHECSFKIYKRNPDRFEPYSIEPGYDSIFPHDRQWKIYGRVIGVVGYVGSENDEVRLLTYLNA
jgi:transcriptional regulator with XRE-family HTH domain